MLMNFALRKVSPDVKRLEEPSDLPRTLIFQPTQVRRDPWYVASLPSTKHGTDTPCQSQKTTTAPTWNETLKRMLDERPLQRKRLRALPDQCNSEVPHRLSELHANSFAVVFLKMFLHILIDALNGCLVPPLTRSVVSAYTDCTLPFPTFFRNPQCFLVYQNLTLGLNPQCQSHVFATKVSFLRHTRQVRSFSTPTNNQSHCLRHVTRVLVATWRVWPHIECEHCAETQRPRLPIDHFTSLRNHLSFSKYHSTDATYSLTRTTNQNAWCVSGSINLTLLHCLRPCVALKISLCEMSKMLGTRSESKDLVEQNCQQTRLWYMHCYAIPMPKATMVVHFTSYQPPAISGTRFSPWCPITFYQTPVFGTDPIEPRHWSTQRKCKRAKSNGKSKPSKPSKPSMPRMCTGQKSGHTKPIHPEPAMCAFLFPLAKAQTILHLPEVPEQKSPVCTHLPTVCANMQTTSIICSVNHMQLPNDILPSTRRSSGSCLFNLTANTAKPTTQLVVSFIWKCIDLLVATILLRTQLSSLEVGNDWHAPHAGNTCFRSSYVAFLLRFDNIATLAQKQWNAGWCHRVVGPASLRCTDLLLQSQASPTARDNFWRAWHKQSRRGTSLAKFKNRSKIPLDLLSTHMQPLPGTQHVLEIACTYPLLPPMHPVRSRHIVHHRKAVLHKQISKSELTIENRISQGEI